jgi:hypothetical protein
LKIRLNHHHLLGVGTLAVSFILCLFGDGSQWETSS